MPKHRRFHCPSNIRQCSRVQIQLLLDGLELLLAQGKQSTLERRGPLIETRSHQPSARILLESERTTNTRCSLRLTPVPTSLAYIKQVRKHPRGKHSKAHLASEIISEIVSRKACGNRIDDDWGGLVVL